MDNTAPSRLSITFGSNRLAFLQAEADRLDLAIADLLRHIVDQYREQSSSAGWTASCPY